MWITVNLTDYMKTDSDNKLYAYIDRYLIKNIESFTTMIMIMIMTMLVVVVVVVVFVIDGSGFQIKHARAEKHTVM